MAAATLLAAITVTGTKLTEQRIVMLGLGSSGRGIAELLVRAMVAEGATEAEARDCFYAVGRHGLLVEGAEGIHPEQKDFVRRAACVKDWDCKSKTRISLLDIVNNAKPTVLIGTSGLQGAFTEDAVRAMANHVERPIIFPLSNPTSKSEAEPQQLLDWTDGKALIGTGSPFPPVHFAGKEIPIDQTNNSYIFPGMGLGILVAGATRVTDEMFTAAGQAVAKMSPAQMDKTGRLLPPVGEMREVRIRWRWRLPCRRGAMEWPRLKMKPRWRGASRPSCGTRNIKFGRKDQSHEPQRHAGLVDHRLLDRLRP